VSFLLVTIPVSLLLAACLLGLVIHAVRTGGFDDWDGPAMRMLEDDDSQPELDPDDAPQRRRDAAPPHGHS